MSVKPDVDAVVHELLSAPVRCGQATQPPSSGGVPAVAGLYAWWADAGAIDGIPIRPHPDIAGISLLYVGISPARLGSGQTLRGRIVGNHLHGNTGSSTFRLTLAAFLFDAQGWRPIARGPKTTLAPADNRALSNWQADRLAVSWSLHAEPWAVEQRVIERMQPPLNLAANAGADFYETVREARRRFRAASGEPA